MTRTCPQCTRPLPPTRNGLDLLRERASAAEWRRYFTAPRGRSSCPQCHATLRKVTTRAGYLCYLGMLVTMGLSAVLIWMFFPVNSLVGQRLCAGPRDARPDIQVALAHSVSAHSLCLRIRCSTPRPPCSSSGTHFRCVPDARYAMAQRRLGCPCRWPSATRPDPTPTADYAPALHSPWRAALVPLIAFLCAVPFLVCYSKWGYTWKLKLGQG